MAGNVCNRVLVLLTSTFCDAAVTCIRVLINDSVVVRLQEMMLAELVRQTGDCGGVGGGGGKAEGALAMMHAMQAMYGGTPMDPFIAAAGQSQAVVEAHARQNSTDSGLGTPHRTAAPVTLHHFSL